MAQKKAPKPVVTIAETEIKPVRLDLTADVHRLLRLVSAHANQSMASYAREVIRQHVYEEAKRRGIKP
jgi:hypothetical protein